MAFSAFWHECDCLVGYLVTFPFLADNIAAYGTSAISLSQGVGFTVRMPRAKACTVYIRSSENACYMNRQIAGLLAT